MGNNNFPSPLSPVNCQLSPVNRQPSTVNCHRGVAPVNCHL